MNTQELIVYARGLLSVPNLNQHVSAAAIGEMADELERLEAHNKQLEDTLRAIEKITDRITGPKYAHCVQAIQILIQAALKGTGKWK